MNAEDEEAARAWGRGFLGRTPRETANASRYFGETPSSEGFI
jgi:hypothetical protein